MTSIGLSTGGLAAKAGMKAGDQLVKIDDVAIGSRDALRKALDGGTLQKSVTLKRAGKDVTVVVTFEK